MVKFNEEKITSDFQKRMVDEYNQLDERLTKLTAALNTDGFDAKVGKTQYRLMIIQANAMSGYRTALLERMEDMGMVRMRECECDNCKCENA